MDGRAAHSFHFLYRTDRGHVGRDAWRRGAAPLFVIAAVATAGWVLIRPWASHDLGSAPFLDGWTILAFLYLVAYAFGLILLSVCFYNISAKRFRDRGRPPALAALLPLAAFLAGALLWFIPRSFGAAPGWTGPVAIVIVLVVAAATIADLGFGDGRVPHP